MHDWVWCLQTSYCRLKHTVCVVLRKHGSQMDYSWFVSQERITIFKSFLSSTSSRFMVWHLDTVQGFLEEYGHYIICADIWHLNSKPVDTPVLGSTVNKIFSVFYLVKMKGVKLVEQYHLYKDSWPLSDTTWPCITGSWYFYLPPAP